MFRFITAAVTIAYASAAIAAPQHQASSAGAADSTANSMVVCKYVVTAEQGSKPFRLCRTRAEWAAKEKKDARDPNRIICRYEEKPGTKITSRKVCQPASEWAAQREMHRDQVQDIQMRVCVPGAGC